jgi:hypothetical protein
LKDIGELTNLVDLQLRHAGVTDAGLKDLKKLDKLETLYLNNTRVTGEGLKELKELTEPAFQAEETAYNLRSLPNRYAKKIAI